MGCGFRAPQQHTARWIQESELAIRPKAPSSPLLDTNTHRHTQRDIQKAQPIDSRIYSIKRSITQSREHWRSDWGNTIIALQSQIFQNGSRERQYVLVTSTLDSLRNNTNCTRTNLTQIFPVLLMRQKNCWNTIRLQNHRSGLCLI